MKSTTSIKFDVTRMLLAASAATFLFCGAASAGPILTTTDDGYTGNDPNRGPTVGGDRNEASAFFEVRHNTTAPRKKIGYIKYNIAGVDPSLFPTATLSGGFSTTSQDGAGTWNIYGLNDGVTNTDDVADGSFGEANWTEGSLTYDKGLGVDPSVSTADASLVLDLSEITLLGTITLPGDAPFASNPTDLPLGAFLAADTNDVVTFLITDANGSGAEWRVTARENTDGGTDTSGPGGIGVSGGVLLSFVPEPSSFSLLIFALFGLGARQFRRDPQN